VTDVWTAERGVDASAGGTPRLLYVIGTYPSLTTTFIDREIELLRRRGVSVQVISLRRPDHQLSPAQRSLKKDVRYVLPVKPLRLMASHVRCAVSRPLAYLTTFVYLLTRRHPSLRARVKTLLHLGMAVHVSELVRRGPAVDHIHAHFVDRATTVALVIGRLLDLPYSATAHANDIYVAPVMLAEKIAGASFIATCTRYNADHLASIAPPGSAGKVVCIHHGLDLEAYEPRRESEPGVPMILSIAQLKPKKGLVDLIDACAELHARGYAFTCELVGEGPLRNELQTRIDAHALGDVVELIGALDHAAVVARLRRASVFALPCVTAADGDRDGIPNVILEAMAMEVPVVSTRHSGIPEAVEDGQSGVLVEPHAPSALSNAIASLLDDPRQRRRFGERGRQIVLASFDIDDNAHRLLRRFTLEGVPGG
jgi:colanic acid/amylovoran biosynthesis glycosyltransferase